MTSAKMDSQMKTITELSKVYQERGPWEKFQSDSRMSQRFSSQNSDKKRTGAVWFTTNSEYGRFQTFKKGSSIGSDRSSSQLDEAANAAAGNRRQSGQAGSTCGVNPSRRSTAGIKLPPIDEGNSKSGTASKQEPEVVHRPPTMRTFSPSLGIPPPPDRKRLTTGYAKQYMIVNHNRFWENMQTVAEGAGLDLRTRGGTRQSQADVLTVEGSEERGVPGMESARDDDAYSHSVPSLDGSLPPTPKEGRN